MWCLNTLCGEKKKKQPIKEGCASLLNAPKLYVFKPCLCVHARNINCVI